MLPESFSPKSKSYPLTVYIAEPSKVFHHYVTQFALQSDFPPGHFLYESARGRRAREGNYFFALHAVHAPPALSEGNDVAMLHVMYPIKGVIKQSERT